jgi:hypothetical protein
MIITIIIIFIHDHHVDEYTLCFCHIHKPLNRAHNVLKICINNVYSYLL